MITAAHVILFTKDADADRAFIRDVLHFPSVAALPLYQPRHPVAHSLAT